MNASIATVFLTLFAVSACGANADFTTDEAELGSANAELEKDIIAVDPGLALATDTVVSGAVSMTLQTCTGPATSLAPGGTQVLTCNVNTTLAGNKMLVLPEMFIPGNGCIVADSKPQVVVVGNSSAVRATMRNRCGWTYSMSEGGLGWVVVELGSNGGSPLLFNNIAGGTLQTCKGPATALAPGATTNLTCSVNTTLGGNQMLVLPEMHTPGNGCIVANDAPRVVVVGNSTAVSTTLRNRCGSTYLASEGGLGWMIFQTGGGTNQTRALQGVDGGAMQTCSGPSTPLWPGVSSSLTCNVTSPLGGNQMLTLPEMYVPGNGCIVASSKPRVAMVGNNFGVSATMRNRCSWPYAMSEGGLGWLIWDKT
jgi:hypothetical protein